MGGHINDIPMIRWVVETSGETEGGPGRGGRQGGWFEPRMSPALYADEEGRATMTRDVGAEDPFVLNRKKLIRQERGSSFGSCLPPPCPSRLRSSSPRLPSVHPDTLLRTTYPYINMSSSRGNRADRACPPASPPSSSIPFPSVTVVVVVYARRATPPASTRALVQLLTKVRVGVDLRTRFEVSRGTS